jgi:5-hydroxyisourate hydrolase
MSAITTHILDISRGLPASGVLVVLEVRSAIGDWQVVGHGMTDVDGRARELLLADTPLAEAVYRLTFDTGAYFAAQNIENFYPEVTVVFTVRDVAAHYHVPLLLSPFGFSTYRGS